MTQILIVLTFFVLQQNHKKVDQKATEMKLLIDPQSRDSASFFVSVKSCNCVSECNQALKNHQIFLRANKSLFPKRSDQKTQQSIVTSLKNLGGGEKVFVFARMQKMERQRVYKGKRSHIGRRQSMLSCLKSLNDERRKKGQKIPS